MAPTRTLLAVLVVLTVGTGVAAAVSGQPVLSATLQTDAVVPGEETTLSITIVNNGSVVVGSLQNPALTQRVTTARGLKIQVDRDDEAPITVQAGTYAVGSLPEGGAVPLQVPVTVDEDVSPGDYRVPINVTYRYTSRIGQGGVEETETVHRDLNVTLTVERAPRFTIRNVTSPVRVGSTDTLSLDIENTGPAAADEAILSLSSSNGDLTFGGAPSATRFVGDWASGETRTVAFEVTAAPTAGTQSYPLDLQAVYEGRDGSTERSAVQTLAVRPAPAQPFAVSKVSDTLTVGGEGRLAGTITNTGDEPVENAVVVFADQRASVTPLETEYAVGALRAGESARFSFPIQVSEEAEPGPRLYSIRTRYRTAGDAVVESPALDVPARVGPTVPAFTVSADDATLEPGGSGTLQVTVTNNGDATYADVSAKLFAQSPLSTGDDEAFVSELEPGESTELTFQLAAGSTALEKAYPVSLDFRYDADGDTETSDTYRLPVTVAASEDAGGTPWLPIAVVGLVVLVAGGYYLRTRR